MAIVIKGDFKPSDPLGLYRNKVNPLGATAKPSSRYNPLEGNPDNDFTTPLTPSEEKAFEAWKAKYRPDDTGEDYDLRGAFKAGLTPSEENGHFPDTFKKPNHSTFSKESKYAPYAPDLAGSWDAEGNYVPSEARARAEATAAAQQQTAASQATFAELEAKRPGRYQLISADQYDKWKAEWDAKNRSDGLLGDTVRLLDAGAAGLEQSINELVGKIPVVGKPLQDLADAFDKFAYGSPGYTERMQEVIDRNVATLTPETQAARGEQWWNEETNFLGSAWLNPRSYFAGAVESLPSMAATMLPAMWLARGAYVTAIAKGATEKVAAAAAAKTALVAGAVTEGGLGGAQTAQSVRETIARMPREKLLETDAVKALIGQGMAPDAAIAAITDDAATQAFVIGGVATGIFGGFGDRFLAKLIAEGVGGGFAKRMVRGALRGVVAEGILEEMPQEGFGQVAQNLALRNTVNPEQDLLEGVPNAALGGVAIGGAMGATLGGIGGAARPAEAAPEADTGPEVIAPRPAPPAATVQPKPGPLAAAVEHGLANGMDEVPVSAPIAATTQILPDAQPVPLSPVDEISAPPAGSNVVVDAEGLDRFTGRVESYVDTETGPEALVVDTSTGELVQVPLGTLRTAKLSEQLIEQMDAPAPIVRDPVETPDDTTRVVRGSRIVMPDALHARLYDFGQQRKITKGITRTLGDDALRANDEDPETRKALADELQVPVERVNELADDYRYRVEKAAKASSANGLPLNMHALNKELLQRYQLQRLRAEKAAAETPPAAEPAMADLLESSTYPDDREATSKEVPKIIEGTIDAPAHAAATSPTNDLPEPTQAQKEAGNYKLGHFKTGGLDISIENPAGSERKGVDKGGKAWSVTMKSHYGYLKGTIGRDKDHIDVFVKDGTAELDDNAPVFVIDQVVDGKFDEHKVMLGFKTLAQARNAYKANYAKGWKGLGDITATTLSAFKDWTRNGDTRKQFAKTASDYAEAMPEKDAPAAPSAGEQPRLTLSATRKGDFIADSISQVDEMYKLSSDVTSPELGNWYALEQISNGTLLHYAKVYGVKTGDRTRAEIWADMQAKGAKSRQSGSIIASDLTPQQVADGLLNEFRTPTGVVSLPDNLFERFKEALIAHSDQIVDRASKREPEDQNWVWGIKQQVGEAVFTVEIVNYGPGPASVMAIRNSAKDNGDGSRGDYERFVKKFIKDFPADQTATPAALPNATAPEHVVVGVDDRELGQIVKEFNDAQADMIEGDHPVSNVFQAPRKGEIIRLNDNVKVYHKDHGWMTPAEAAKRVAEWKDAAQAQGDDPKIRSANSDKVVLSLFDLSGKWSQPWEDAGYQVYRFDIQDNPETGDVNNFSAEFFGDWFGDFDGLDIYAVLAACPCTDFAVSGAKHFAAKDADGRTVASVKLVHQTLRVIEYFKPAIWAVENPVGRIEQLGGLPPWRLSFDPNHLGEPYTKKTLIWGRFNADLPIAPVEPTEGSKMWAKYGGKSIATKNARSETPEGFSYGFFMANNAHDHPAMAVANKFDRLDRGLIEQAIDAGVTPEDITSAVEDFYYMDLDDEAANDAIRALLPSPTKGMKASPAPQILDLFHGTDTTFDRFERTDDIGFHLGSRETASKRLEQMEAGTDGAIMPVRATFKNLLRLPDLHTWSPRNVVRAFQDAGVITADEADSAEIVDNDWAREVLAAAGYDGIVYSNETEGGGDSFIAMDPDQIERVGPNFSPQKATAKRPWSEATGRQLVDQVKTYLVADGIKTGMERVLAFNPDGTVAADLAGDHRFVAFTPEFEAQIRKPDANVVVHHNHPQSTPLSAADMVMLAFPGLKAVWAHGHDGKSTRASLTAAGRAHLATSDDPKRLAQELKPAFDLLPALRKEIQRVLDTRSITPGEATIGSGLLMGEAWRDAGLLDYHSEIQLADALRADKGVMDVVNRYSSKLREQYGTLAGANGNDRPADPVRHAADVEGAFGRTPETAAKDTPSRSDDRRGTAKDQQPAEGVAAAFAKNKLFTADKVAAAKERLKSKMGQLNSGIDPEVLVDGMTIAGAYIEAGVRNFADYAKQMADDFGPRIRPYLLSFWEGARNYPGLDTKGMTPPDESARLHAELNVEQLPVEEAAALGQELAKPKTRAKKTGRAADRTLVQDFGVEHIDGWTDLDGTGTATDFGVKGGVKDNFLKDAVGYLQAVASELQEAGYTPSEDNKGRPMKAVTKNESGPATSGDVNMSLWHPETKARIYVHIGGSALRGTVPSTPSGVSIMFRVGIDTDRYATRAGNQWAPVDLSAADFAAMVQKQAERLSKGVEYWRTKDFPSKDDKQGAISDLKALIARPALVPEAEAQGETRADQPELEGPARAGAEPGRSEPELRPQSGSASADRGHLEAGEPGDVEAPAVGGRRRPARSRGAAADVGRAGEADLFGDAGDGRPGAGRESAPDAGAGIGSGGSADARGSVSPVKAPEAVSPANKGPGNFHIEDPLKIVGGGQVARFEKNRKAIELANTLRDEGRMATREEQEVLAGYTGWGSFGQDLFQGTWANPRPKAGWEQRDAWLRDNLGQAQWESLQRSITNAHYTDPPTVLAMWNMVKRMGFAGGRVLEPAMGIGNFFGMMPLELKNRSNLSGIELEQVTGDMAKLLYPDANISIMGYQDSKTPDDFYDLVIGNWPFEDTVIADRRYNRLAPFLHDYFYLKALDQTRPGGLVIGITSKGTLDKKDSNIRTELAKKGELVAAFRLPSGAFEDYAGTNVVTDVIVLRKRAKPLGNAADAGWIKSVPYRTPSGGEVSINEYYMDNPSHVIGTIEYGHGTTFRRPGMIVNRPDDMAAQIERITALVPEGAYQPEARAAKQISYITNHTADREGALVRTANGLHIVRGEHLAPANEVAKYELKDSGATATRVAQLEALIDLRRAYADLIAAERGQTGSPDAARKALKTLYDGFVATHGDITSSFGLSYLRKIDDPFYPALAALEQRGPKGVRPAAILTESTIRAPRKIDKPTIADAFVLARNTAINPSLADIAKIAGRPEDEVRAELIDKGAVFELPGGDIAPADLYLSGNVREKMRQALAARDAGNTAMERNVAALAKVMPADVPYYSIEVQMGASWVPTRTYADYIAHMLNAPSSDGIEVYYTAGRWRIVVPPALKARPEASAGFGTEAYSFQKLVNAAISNQTVTIRKEDSDGTSYVDEDATAEVNEKIANIRTSFGDWLWSDPERRVDLEAEYNEVRNAYASPSFDGSFLSFEGMALSLGRGPFDLREHQANAIWRALVMRRSLNAHEVGTGKTFTMGGIAVESRRYGIAKKPLIFAHNANSASVAAEIGQMYPAAKVLYIDNLTPAQIDIKMRQIANDDWDAVVVPHSLISRFSLTEETLMKLAAEEIAAIEAEAYEAAKDDGVGLTERMLDDPEELKKLRSPTAKDLVKMRNRIIENIKKQGQRASKEGAVSFEELGIDMVLVDEAHEFKKPPFSTRMRIKGLNTQSSDRSIALNFLLKFIRSEQNGGNVHLFTGTPVTNTLTEVFHAMRYIMAEEMAEVSVDQWDGWFGSFAREVQDVELNAAAEYESVNRLAGFINVPELRRMIGQYMDVVFADDMPEMKPRRTQSGKVLSDPSLTAKERAELLNGRTENAMDRPYKKVVVETADLTPAQQKAFAQIQGYAKRWRDMTGKEKKEAMLAGAPESPIIYEGLAAKASFDVRLMRGEDLAGMEGKAFDDPNSKASRVVKNVLEIYHSSPLTTQVIFTNAGLSTTATRSIGAVGDKSQERYKVFSTVGDIVERLVAQGIPRAQIAVVDGSTSKEKRKETADAMNRAEIRVVIGSTQSLGVGVNMQRNLRAMHHMDAPWMPGDLEQRNGRGMRQGNQWNTVLEYRYLTDRIDGRRWQVLAIKQRFINAFLKADDTTRVIEGDAASEEESDILTTFAEAAGDPRVLIRAKLRKKIDQLLKRQRLHDNGVVDAGRSAVRLERRRDELRAEYAKLLPVADKAEALSKAMAGDGFSITVEGKTYDKRGDAREAIDELVESWKDFGPGADARTIGKFGGYTLQVRWPRQSQTPAMGVVIDSVTIEGFAGSLSSLEGTLRTYRTGVDKMPADLAETERSIERLRQQSTEPFHQAADLKRAENDLEALELDLAVNPVPPPAWLRTGAPVDTEVWWAGEKHLVTGHRWTAQGWFVLASGADAPLEMPYLDVRDEQGMPLYEERPFTPPEVLEKPKKADDAGGENVADIVPFGRGAPAQPTGTDALRAELARSRLGAVIEKLIEAGRIRLVDGRVAGSPAAQAQAWTEPNGRITLNAALVEPGEALAVLLHEAFHAGAQNLVGDAAWKGLQRDLKSLLKQFKRGKGRARQFYDEARERLAWAQQVVEIPEDLAVEEFAAYALEEYEVAPPALRKWIDDVVGVIKAWLLRRFGRQFGDVTPAQLRSIAAMALQDAAGGTAAMSKASIARAITDTSSAAFKSWFGNSKVVDATGAPLVVYHGTRAQFEAFDPKKLGTNTGADDPGIFFTSDRALAADYGRGMLRRGRVVEAYLSLQNPRIVDATRIEAGSSAKWLILSQAQEDGFDGVIFRNMEDRARMSSPEARSDVYVAFKPTQIKSVDNRGTFDPADPRMRASIKAPKVREVSAAAAGKWTDIQPKLLATVPLTYFAELARPGMTAVKEYLRVKRNMDAYRGDRHAMADALAQDWLKFSRLGAGLLPSEKGKAMAEKLSRLMHNSTLAGVDPSITEEEETKKAGYEQLRARFLELPRTGQALFTNVRDAYVEQTQELDKLILNAVAQSQKIAAKKAQEAYEVEVEQIRADRSLDEFGRKEALDKATDRHAKAMLKSTYASKARLTQLRQNFEANRVPAPYFPLARFGRYFVSVRDADGHVVSFSRRERAADNARLAREMAEAYPQYKIETGVIDEGGAGLREAMDPRMVGEIQKILGDAGVDSTVMDAIWQRYLQSMPDLSIRKRHIHRKGTSGFDGDALRAFSSQSFHFAHQAARLKYGIDLQEMLDQAAIQARKSDDPIRATTLTNELALRHKWVMNPTGSSAVQAVTSAMFVWYLAATPAAAIVNLTQTPMLGLPIIGARFGMAKTTNALLKASRDFISGRGEAARSKNLSAEEKEVMARMYESGLIDRTQSHDLAGVGDTGVKYSALRSRVMGIISWGFHKTEVANREVTALAAYRLARSSGLSVQQALDTAHDLTWKIHFDYSNSSRPRLLQGDAAKLLLVFQNYALNTWYRLFRDVHQSLLGETHQAKREARYQLAGMVGMMTLLGGVTGVFGYNVLMALLGIFFDDEDDPYTFEEEMRRHTLDLFGPDVGGMILNGVPGHLLKIDLTSRVGMPDFFVRSPDNTNLDGRDWWKEWLVGALGVVPNTIINWGDGFGLIMDGNAMRGLELMAPKAIKDVMQSYRFANEGLTTRRGDEIRPSSEFSPYELLLKGIGFTPAAVAETYGRNSSLMNAEGRIMDARSRLLNQYALAAEMGDDVGLERVLERIQAFNKVPAHRGVAITAETVRRSLATRRRNAAKREDGILIQNEQLGRDLRALQPARVN